MKQPKNPFHPGEILLEEFLQPAGVTQTEFAGKLGWTRARLNELIKGKRGMTPDQLAAIMTEHGRRVSASALAKRDIVILCDREETPDVQATLAAWRAWMTAPSMSPN